MATQTNLKNWILITTSGVISALLIYVTTGMHSYIRESHAIDIKIQSRQAEFQKEIKENTYARKQNQEKINELNVEVKNAQIKYEFILKELEKINATLNRILGYGRYASNKEAR
jgi:uncharacterized membrane protein (DUF106 family)